MTQEKMSPLRARMIEDMRIRGMAETSQKAHIRALKDFTAFLGRAPDTATPDELRAYQLHMTDTEVTERITGQCSWWAKKQIEQGVSPDFTPDAAFNTRVASFVNDTIKI